MDKMNKMNEKKRLMIGVIKLFNLCASLDKEPYKCSKEEKYSYLFDERLRNYLFELNLPLTYYNKYREEYGLRKDWKENILALDNFISGKNQVKLNTLINEHQERMSVIKQQVKENKNKEKRQLKSHYNQKKRRKNDNTDVLMEKLSATIRYPYYHKEFKCDVCGFFEEHGRMRAHKKEYMYFLHKRILEVTCSFLVS